MLLKNIFFLIFSLALASTSMASPRTVMIQMFEWPWKDIARECETHLGPMGIAAVQVSPPNEHISLGKHTWWERYQPVSYEIISRSGDEKQFRDMVQRCRNAGVDIYADVILNHMAAIKEGGVGIGGTPFQKYQHSDLYSYQDFHFCGRNGNNEIKNYNDRYEIQFCELLGLADLRTESEYVRNTLADYLNRLLDMGVSGFRIDAAKHIPAEDLATILARVKRPSYVITETYVGYHEPVAFQEYIPFSDINFFPYSFDIGAAFLNSTINRLPELFQFYPESKDVVVFIENHDLQRLRSTIIPPAHKNPQLHKLAHVFMLTWPYGYPQLFSGYAFKGYDEGPPVQPNGMTDSVFDIRGRCKAPWNCEHRAYWMAGLVRFRNETNKNFHVTQVWTKEKERLAYSRGGSGFVAINMSPSAWRQAIPTDLPDGHYCDVLSAGRLAPKECLNWVEVRSGKAQLNMPGRSAVVLLLSASGSNL